MTRRLLASLLVLSIVLSGCVVAQGSDAVAPERGTVWTVLTTVEATVEDNYATVRVIADIGNRGPDPEFPFIVQVPDDAFVTGLTITRDGETFTARIEERADAREEYEDVKRREASGGLVEKQRGSSTYRYLVNTAEFESVRAVLTYERYLRAEEGIVNLDLAAPVSGFGRDLGARFDVTIRHGDGITAAWGTPDARTERVDDGYRLTREVGPRETDASTPFTASYTLSPTGDEGSVAAVIGGNQGWFAHRFRAPADADRLPLDLVLVLDTSGSMGGTKIQQVQDAAVQVVQALGGEDRLHLTFFSNDASSPWPGLAAATAERRAEAAGEIRATIAAGGTNLEAGLTRGVAALEEGDGGNRTPIVVVLTDGQAPGRERLEGLARDASERGAAVFGVAFGRDADWGLVHGLAEAGGGFAHRVPEGAGAEVDLRRFLQALTTPVLKDVRVTYDGDVTAHYRTAPVLFAGSEMLVVGTFDPTLSSIEGVVTAHAEDGERTYAFSEAVEAARDGDFLPRLVAYHEIRRLQDVIAAEGENPERAEAVKTLALEHGFVTDYTSLVLALPERTSQGAVAEESAADDGTFVLDRSGGGPSPAGEMAADHDGAAFEGASQPSGIPVPAWVGIAAFGAAAALAARRRKASVPHARRSRKERSARR